MTDCPFCQLMQNPEQLNLIGETENFYAWLEYPQPRAKGHANIVPKEHTESIMDLSPEEYMEAMKLLRETMEKEVEGLDADGLSIAINVKEAGGQMLPHAYIQVFPRFQQDENAGTPIGAIFPQKEELQSQEYFEDTVEKLNSVNVEFEQEVTKPHPDSQKFKEKDTEKPDNSEKEVETESEDTSEEDEIDLTKRGESVQWQ